MERIGDWEEPLDNDWAIELSLSWKAQQFFGLPRFESVYFNRNGGYCLDFGGKSIGTAKTMAE